MMLLCPTSNDVSEARTKRSEARRMASTDVRFCLLKSASVCPGVMPQREMPFSLAMVASMVAESVSNLLSRSVTDVSEALTKSASAMAFGPSGVLKKFPVLPSR